MSAVLGALLVSSRDCGNAQSEHFLAQHCTASNQTQNLQFNLIFLCTQQRKSLDIRETGSDTVKLQTG